MAEQEQIIEDELRLSVMELVWSALDGHIKSDQLIVLLAEKKEKNEKQFESLLADVISLIDVEIGAFGVGNNTTTNLLSSSNNQESSMNTQTKREKFFSIVNTLRPLIGDDLLKERLEIETLENLKLIAKKETFNQKYIKIKTRLFYKQQKFNLLREEAEGYSKLIAELGQSNLSSRILENIQSLIGCFNLDPNRVLDIILESFENNPSMHHTFIGLLKHYKAEDETICQIVGFKYQSLHQLEKQLQQEMIAADDRTQFNNSANSLYLVTSYLLKYNMIDLDLLLPHLYPTEQQVHQFYKEEFEAARQYAKKLTIVNLSSGSSGSGGSGSGKDSKTSSSDTTQLDHQQQLQQQQLEELKNLVKHQINRLSNQKICLIRSLVQIGDYKTALKIIEKMPQWYLATYPDLSMEICKAVDQNILDLIYKKCNPLSKYFKEKYLNQTLAHKLKQYKEHSKMAENDEFNPRPTVAVKGHQSKLEELLGTFVESVLPILSALGPGVSYDPILYTKLVRICIAFLDMKKLSDSTSLLSGNNGNSNNDDENNNNGATKEQSPQPCTQPSSASSTQTKASNGILQQFSPAQIIFTLSPNELAFYNQICTILNDVLMPSLSMISMNPCLAIELWNLLKMFPYEMRYYLYNNWRQNTYKHFPLLIKTKAECQEKIKYLLKRLTKENVKIHGRQIGKLSHNNPIIVCDYILTQIQRYDNFIIPIVDSLKFLTPLSYDVLSYCTIIAISDADKDKMKHDSTSISSWLQSVATFCALAFKKYPIELTAIIQYVINQLKNRKSYDLLILQEIVQKMCGIEVLSEVNDLQLEAMAGGDLLRQEAGYFNPIRNIKKCANRLKEALADHGLILPLCILLSQQRDYIVYLDQDEREQSCSNTEKQHLKLTGSLYDQCQDSLVQFSQFLSSTLTTEEYIEIFPKIDELVNVYHVSADVAFFLSRPMYAHHIQSKYDELRRMDRNTKSAEKPTKTQRYLESIDCVMQPVIDLVRTLHTSKIWEDMSPLFYTTFWTLSMSDCFVPTNAYEKQRASLKQKLNALDDNTDLTTTKKRKEKEKIFIMLEKLAEEENKQKDHVQHVKARFEKEKEFWFPQKSKTKNETITVFLQLCIFSRCLFTQIDAYYCAKFIQIIHSLKTPNFSTIICYDRIFSDISYSIASLTDNEARKYGRFLLGLLETVMSWHSDPTVFEAECAQFPGFLTVFRNALNSNANSATAQSPSANKQEQLDYENFRHVCHKWHYKLTKSFIVCLESEEYLQMRNSLIILTKILPHYPRLTGFCSALEKRVEKIKQVEKDKKQDIYTLALVYLGQLKQRKPHMVDEAKFHLKETTITTAQSTTPKQQATGGSEFFKINTSSPATNTPVALSKPISSSLSNGNETAKFKQPFNPSTSLASSSSIASKQNVSVNQSAATFASKQISAVLQANQATQQQQQQIVSNSNQSNTSNSTINQITSKSNGQIKLEGSAKENNGLVTSSSSTSSTSSNSTSVSTTNGNSSSRGVVVSSPPSSNKTSSSSRDDQSIKEKYVSNGTSSSSSTVQMIKTSLSGSKRGISSSTSSQNISSPTHFQQHNSLSQPMSSSNAQLTPTRKSNEYSPTSPVSSDDCPSPKPSNHSSHHQRRKSHSRSSSPKTSSNPSSSTANANNSNTGYYTNSSSSTGSGNSSKSSSEKSKRLKTSDESNSSKNNYLSTSNTNNGNNTATATTTSSSNGGSHESYAGLLSNAASTATTATSNTSSSSSKRKSSRERSERSDKEKEKKDHRKREHSMEDSEMQHKRSKSDETKSKKSSSSSSSTQNINSTNNNSNSNSSSSSSSNKRSSKKHDSKDEFPVLNNLNNNGNSHPLVSSGGSSTSSSKHRSSGDDRRSTYEKNSHYLKEKK